MVTSGFERSFIEEKNSEQNDIEIIEGDDGLKVMKDGRDFSGVFGMKDLVRDISTGFGLDVEEAVDFDKRYEEFGGRRKVTDSLHKTALKYIEAHGEDNLSELSDRLRTDTHSLGDDIWNFLRTPESDILADDSGDYMDELLEPESSVDIEDQLNKAFKGPYREAALEAYSTFEDEIDTITGLGHIAGQKVTPETFDVLHWLKGKQHDPNWDQEIDQDEVEKRLSSEIDTQLRRKTLDALKAQAHSKAGKIYEELTGKRPTEIDKDMVYGTRAWIITSEKESQDKIESMLKHGRDHYFDESSASYDMIGELEQPVLDVLKDGIGRKQYEVDGRTVDLYIATPLEGLRYGDEFDTCESVAWPGEEELTNRTPVNRSSSITIPILYAEDENGSIVAREKLNYDMESLEAGEPSARGISNGHPYMSLESHNLNQELKNIFRDYKDGMRSKLGFPTEQQSADIDNAVIHHRVYDEWCAPEKIPQH